MTKLTEKHTAFLASLPEMFYLVEDFNRGCCPPTEIVDADSGRVVDTFHAGQSRLFETLRKAGRIECAGYERENGVGRGLFAKVSG